eukprot:3653487-Rhodomonas_salina.1
MSCLGFTAFGSAGLHPRRAERDFRAQASSYSGGDLAWYLWVPRSVQMLMPKRSGARRRNTKQEVLS